METGKLKDDYYESPRQSIKSSSHAVPKGEKAEGVKLVQDFFGYYYGKNGQCVKIKRFTWTNHNKIEVQVINYGARIVSIKYPDRKGVIDDIVLGFDDLAGYIFYQKYHFGATIGRMTNVVKNSRFKIGDKEYRLKPNMINGHHRDGGTEGFDQVIWKTGVQGKKVFMTHMCPHGHEGYPGNLLVRLSFELSTMNEFKIDIEAYTTEPTIVNISNLLYLNLGGHHTGPNSIYNHIVTINCNSYTKQDKDGLCNGEIWNVVHSPLDFQTPRTLGKCIGLVPKDGFYQNMCINRGVTQEDCFVARIRHPASGRFIEVYSNQFGVQLDTANHFGLGHVLSMEQIGITKEINDKQKVLVEPQDSTLRIIDCLHGRMLDELRYQEETYYAGFKRFLRLLKKACYKPTPIRKTVIELPKKSSRFSRTPRNSVLKMIPETKTEVDGLEHFTCSPDQMLYLTTLESVLREECFDEAAEWLIKVVGKLIYYANRNMQRALMQKSISKHSDSDSDIDPSKASEQVSNAISNFHDDTFSYIWSEYRNSRDFYDIDSKSFDSGESFDLGVRKPDTNANLPGTISASPTKNVIPPYYKSCDEIIGKGRALYKRHGGIAFQTQNYPNCANIEKFPSCVLNPGETYRHTITYKFWIRSGNPSRWIRRTTLDIAAKKLKLQQQ
ncbi:uncharacterized protein LOC130896035 [Diorhabda carinulata]|uniref:uncharacterized protein LOC130896035 n=1 Tax=Diorhabda carinulata TaxID=1163345 RepID=UPI0025A1D33C|nr:uncharacterized protein LOC130896035 [Diorhabda carinulata]